MLSETISCRHCGGTRLLNNGHAPNGKLRYFCQGCKRYGRQDASLGGRTHPEEFRAQVLAAYQERASMRGVCRVFGISRNTLAAWLKKSQ